MKRNEDAGRAAEDRLPIDPRQRRPVPRKHDDRFARWSVVALAAVAVGLFVAAFTQDWWQIWLFAPQYPQGLHMEIRLTGVGGDAHEIDMLNHYIGMAHLFDAAPIERQIAGYAVAFIGLATLALTLLAGKRGHWALLAAGLALPLGFIVDSFAWMWWYGNHLDRRAPLNIPAFTPQLFGEGAIGQFHTYARPQLGFGLACAALVLLAVAAWVRHRVCRDCELAPTCGLVCPRHFVGGPLPPEALPSTGEPSSTEVRPS